MDVSWRTRLIVICILSFFSLYVVRSSGQYDFGIFFVLVGCLIIALIIMGFVLWFLKEYKSTNDDTLHVLMILILVAVIFPVIIFYLDDFNFFTKMGYLENADSGNWHSFFSTYGSTLVSTMISAVFLVWATGVQIRSAKKDNSDLAKEELRLQNLPVLKFKIDCDEDNRVGPTYFIDSDMCELRYIIPVNISINNIGLGTAQNIQYMIVVDSKNTIRGLNEEQIIYKDSEYNYTFYFEVPALENYHKYMLLFIFYEDLLGNKYVQKNLCNIDITKEEKDGKLDYVAFSTIMPVGSNKFISDKFSYINEPEFGYMKKNMKYSLVRDKITSIIGNIDKLDKVVNDCFSNGVDVLKLIKDYFYDEFPFMEGGGVLDGYELIDNTFVNANATYSMGINPFKCIVVTRVLTFELKTLSLVSSELKVLNNSLTISSSKLNNFEKYLKKLSTNYDK